MSNKQPTKQQKRVPDGYYRWKNGDGSLGGLVAENAEIHPSVHIPWTSIVHQHAVIDIGAIIKDSVKIGRHSYIGVCVILGNDVSVGKHVVIDSNTNIMHDTQIGDHVGIGAFCTIGKDKEIAPHTCIPDRTFDVDHISPPTPSM